MAKSVNVGYTDTPISGVSSLTLSRGLVNYGADFKVKSDEPNEAIITNLTCPISYPEKFRWSYSDVADVYKGTGIDPGLFAPTRRGVSLLCQLTETWKVTDSVDASYEVALPVSAHVVLKVPTNDNITPAMVQTLIGRLISGLYETGLNDTKRLSALLRGSLEPADL